LNLNANGRHVDVYCKAIFRALCTVAFEHPNWTPYTELIAVIAAAMLFGDGMLQDPACAMERDRAIASIMPIAQEAYNQGMQ